jgi:Dolichyl-phosphate-mannose-protein mannosyltransferase
MAAKWGSQEADSRRVTFEHPAAEFDAGQPWFCDKLSLSMGNVVSASATIAPPSRSPRGWFSPWTRPHSYLLLTALTLFCLLPFSGRAFHVDDPLFLWSAQQITKHPLDPYGFNVLWDNYTEPMSAVTKNPPLACYYAALIGSIAGWSERALHLGFLLPALALLLGTYRLASRFTRSPLLAATATLLTPGVMVSASSVMCDIMMLALWVWAASLWIEGLDHHKPFYLTASSLLIGLAALTKYFGISLLPLLLAYSLVRKRRLGWWSLYFLLPLGLLAGYQFWTAIQYGHPMFSDAFDFAQSERVINGKVPASASVLMSISFIGGCALPALLFSPLLLRWKNLSIVLLSGAVGGFALVLGWVGLGHFAEQVVRVSLRAHWLSSGLQLTLFVAAGICVLWFAVAELRNWTSAEPFFLGLWVAGTFVFVAFVNWTINARTVLPLIPASGILIARRLEHLPASFTPQLQRRIVLALAFSGAVSCWLAKADADLANAARQAAVFIHQQTYHDQSTVWFQGHWGFQYYMQRFGARPIDFLSSTMDRGDVLIVPENNADAFKMPSPEFVASSEVIEVALPEPLFTMRWRSGAGFYASFYGPLPFAFGAPASERYYLIRLRLPMARRLVRKSSSNSTPN